MTAEFLVSDESRHSLGTLRTRGCVGDAWEQRSAVSTRSVEAAHVRPGFEASQEQRTRYAVLCAALDRLASSKSEDH